MSRLVLATENKGKVKEFERLFSNLPWKIVPLSEFGSLPEIIETGTTFRENAIQKGTTIAKYLQEWTVADDSGLEVDALKGAPGVYSARFAGIPKDDQRNNEKLLQMLEDVPWEERTARFRAVLALVSPNGKVWTTEGCCEGVIGFESKGEGGFGYDPLFYLPKLGLTMAQLPEEEKNRLSHRGAAIRKLVTYLEKQGLSE